MYHTNRDCPRINTPRTDQSAVYVMGPDEDWVNLSKCTWCKNRDKNKGPVPVLKVFTQLARYKSMGEIITTIHGFRISVKDQPDLCIDHDCSWRFDQ
jgi:hypothetical protein